MYLWGKYLVVQLLDFRVTLFFFKDFIYLFDRETARERGNTAGEWERKKQAPRAEEPDVGLDPGTPGSLPEPKADA